MVHIRLFRFPVRWPYYPDAVASGASERYSTSSSIKVHASGLWLAWREVSPQLSSATAATLGFLGFRWFILPPGNLNDFLWMILTPNSLLQGFHPWSVRIHQVHCPLALRSSTIFWSIPVCALAQTRCIMFCRGAAFPFSIFSSFFFAWYIHFSLAVYLGFFVVFPVVGSSRFLFPLEFDPEKLFSLSIFTSWKSSASWTACRRASIQSLSLA